MNSSVEVRKAVPDDVGGIYQLLKIYSDRQIVLPRSEEDIRFYLANFTVALDRASGELIGCVAVRDFGGGLLEVRSLVVRPEVQKRGVGRILVEGCMERLRRERGAFRLFALTYQTAFFERLGFQRVTRELFPEKIWSDCAKCPKKDCCDETAVLFEVRNLPEM